MIMHTRTTQDCLIHGTSNIIPIHTSRPTRIIPILANDPKANVHQAHKTVLHI